MDLVNGRQLVRHCTNQKAIPHEQCSMSIKRFKSWNSKSGLQTFYRQNHLSASQFVNTHFQNFSSSFFVYKTFWLKFSTDVLIFYFTSLKAIFRTVLKVQKLNMFAPQLIDINWNSNFWNLKCKSKFFGDENLDQFWSAYLIRFGLADSLITLMSCSLAWCFKLKVSNWKFQLVLNVDQFPIKCWWLMFGQLNWFFVRFSLVLFDFVFNFKVRISNIQKFERFWKFKLWVFGEICLVITKHVFFVITKKRRSISTENFSMKSFIQRNLSKFWSPKQLFGAKIVKK